MGLRVEEDCLPRGMNGYYCDALGLIVLHDKLNARQRLCTLQHELIHAHYHDIGCGSIIGLRAELRARRETALTLISPIEYRLAESTYDGEAYSMAVELGSQCRCSGITRRCSSSASDTARRWSGNNRETYRLTIRPYRLAFPCRSGLKWESRSAIKIPRVFFRESG